MLLVVAYHAGVRLPLPGGDGDLAWIGADLCLAAWGFVLARDLAAGDRAALRRRLLRAAAPMLAFAAICTLCAVLLPGAAAAWIRQHALLLWTALPDWAVWAEPHAWSADLWPWRLGAAWLAGAVLAASVILIGAAAAGRRGLLIAGVALLIASPLLRCWLSGVHPDRALGVFGPLRLDAAAAGALLVLWRPRFALAAGVAVVAALALLPLAWQPGGWRWSAPAMTQIGFTLVAVLAWAALAMALSWRRPWRTLSALGASAAPLYLAHGPLVGLSYDSGLWDWLRGQVGGRLAALGTALGVIAVLGCAGLLLRHGRRRLPALLTVALVAGLPAAESDQVEVDGLRLIPGGQLTSADDRVTVHPKAAVTGIWDSNPEQRADARSDIALRFLAGAELRWALGDAALVRGEAQVFGTRHQTLRERDLTGGRLRVDADGTGEVWRPSAGASAMRVDDPLIETGRAVERDEYAAYAKLKRLGERTAITGELRWNAIDYDGSGLSERRDRDRRSLVLGAERIAGEALVVEATAQLFALDYRLDDGPYQDGRGAQAKLGARWQLRERLALAVRLGGELRSHRDHFAGDPAYDDQRVVSPVGEAVATWTIGEASRVRLVAEQQLVEGTTANAAHLTSVRLAGDTRLSGGQFLRADAAWIHRRDAGAAADQAVQTARTLELRLGGVQPLRQGISLIADAVARRQDGERSSDYDQLALRFGVAWAW